VTHHVTFGHSSSPELLGSAKISESRRVTVVFHFGLALIADAPANVRSDVQNPSPSTLHGHGVWMSAALLLPGFLLNGSLRLFLC
jgi:hypothetical protein